jgi:hypothetical protein
MLSGLKESDFLDLLSRLAFTMRTMCTHCAPDVNSIWIYFFVLCLCVCCAYVLAMKPKKNVSISQAMLECAETIMSARRFDDFSEMVSALIREEYDRRALLPYAYKRSESVPGASEHDAFNLMLSKLPSAQADTPNEKPSASATAPKSGSVHSYPKIRKRRK